MDRGEFLSILRESLEGYIPMEDVERSIEEYRGYFEESEESDRELIQQLGDPRLIARTVIDAYRASKGPMAEFYEKQARSEYSQEHSDVYEERGTRWKFGSPGWAGSSILRILFWVALIFVFLGIFSLVFAVVGVLAVYVLPVVLLVLLIRLLVYLCKR